MPPKVLLESMLQSLPYGILAIGREGKVLYANSLGQKYLNLPAGSGYSILPGLGSTPELAGQLKRALKSGQLSFDLLAIYVSGLYLTIRSRPIPEGLCLSIIDVTRSKKTEQHMLNAILEAQEAQRRKLSKEIHDGIGPLISTIKLNLDALRQELSGSSPAVSRRLESISEMLQGMSTDIRSISHNLMPNVLIDFGLVAALENLCQRVNDSGRVHTTFYHSGIKERLGRKLALGLYRIAQELINNAVKYAQAQTISVQLIKHPDSIVLMVEDDGVGIAPEQLKAKPGKGIGLQNIRTRVRSLGGTFLLDSRPGEGVLATIEVPLKPKGHD